ASRAEARAMLFILARADGTPAAAAAATRFARELTASAAFDQALALGDTTMRDAVAQELFARRFDLLFPIWLRERRADFHGAPADFSSWLAKVAAGRLTEFLSAPAAMAFQDVIPADPMLLLPAAAEHWGDSALLAPAMPG